VALNIEEISALYFEVDEPVPYAIERDKIVYITPVLVSNSARFLSCVKILQINKNSIPSPAIIGMSYLQFLVSYYFPHDKNGLSMLSTLLEICAGITKWDIRLDDGLKPYIYDIERGYTIKAKQFDDISKIILYQNIYHYDDRYIDPDLARAMREEDEIRNRDIDIPNLERRKAIISAHTGILPKEQNSMTLRFHQILFEEIVGEVDFETTRSIMLYSGKDAEHWVYRKKRDRFDRYVTSVEQYNKSMGGTGEVATATSNPVQSIMQNLANK
jgi:hypothetical protein